MTSIHRSKPHWIRTALVALAALALIGCATDATGSPSPTAQTDPAVVALPSPVVQVTQAEETPRPTATEGAVVLPLPDPTPTARTGLHATDPESVVLASGNPMLVEFFAFW